jgi:hypothetical protein
MSLVFGPFVDIIAQIGRSFLAEIPQLYAAGRIVDDRASVAAPQKTRATRKERASRTRRTYICCCEVVTT